MVIDRIHLGSVVYAKTLVASLKSGVTTVRREPVEGVLTRRPLPIDRRHHVIEGFHQRHLNPILRRFAQRVP